MKFPIYSVRDSFLGFTMPVIRDNDSVASRGFESQCLDERSPYKVKPECFQLFHIGEFDTDDGSISGCVPRLVASAVDFVRSE